MRKVRKVGALLIDWCKSDSEQGFCLLSLTLVLDSSEVPKSSQTPMYSPLVSSSCACVFQGFQSEMALKVMNEHVVFCVNQLK